MSIHRCAFPKNKRRTHMMLWHIVTKRGKLRATAIRGIWGGVHVCGCFCKWLEEMLDHSRWRWSKIVCHRSAFKGVEMMGVGRDRICDWRVWSLRQLHSASVQVDACCVEFPRTLDFTHGWNHKYPPTHEEGVTLMLSAQNSRHANYLWHLKAHFQLWVGSIFCSVYDPIVALILLSCSAHGSVIKRITSLDQQQDAMIVM